jgi:hypothetical protein
MPKDSKIGNAASTTGKSESDPIIIATSVVLMVMVYNVVN